MSRLLSRFLWWPTPHGMDRVSKRYFWKCFADYIGNVSWADDGDVGNLEYPRGTGSVPGRVEGNVVTKRERMRKLILPGLLAGSLSGCSVLFLNNPPITQLGQPIPPPERCSTSMTLPTLDMMTGGMATVFATGYLLGNDGGFIFDGATFDPIAAGSVTVSLVAWASGIIGQSKVKRCRESRAMSAFEHSSSAIPSSRSSLSGHGAFSRASSSAPSPTSRASGSARTRSRCASAAHSSRVRSTKKLLRRVPRLIPLFGFPEGSLPPFPPRLEGSSQYFRIVSGEANPHCRRSQTLLGGGDPLFQPIHRRYGNGSTVLTSNKGFENWGRILGGEA